MLKRLLFPLLTVTLVFATAASSSVVPVKGVYSAEVALLANHLSELELTGVMGATEETEAEAEASLKKYANTREFLIGMVNDFSHRGWCPERDVPDYSRLLCLQERFTGLFKLAVTEGALDSVEAAILTYYSASFTFTDERVFDIDSNLLPRLGNPKKAPKRDQVLMPQLVEYRFKKLGLTEARKAKGITPTGELDPELVAMLSSHYRKSIRGIGRVNPIEAVIAKYNRDAMGELSRLMSSAVWFMTSDLDLSGTKNNETREFPLNYDDKYAIVMNDLLYKIETKPSDVDSYLYGKPVVLDDAVIAAVLTGEMDLNWARGILASPEFKQPKPDRSKYLRYLGDLSRILLITQPQLLPFYTLGSIIFASVKHNKADRTEYNNETRRIPIRPIR